MTITHFFACASVTNPSLPFSLIIPLVDWLRLSHSRQVQDYFTENRHWTVIVKFQLCSLSLLTHIFSSFFFFFFARLDWFILPQSFISQFNESLTTKSTFKDNQIINQACFILPSFCFARYVLNRIESFMSGGEFRCGCLMNQKWPLRPYNSDPVIL